ncbi:hypothetical protein [Flavobacterium hydrophilum]|uniref:Uncharacterized protein n=1 Tax=Flavobacterium hydrophilum TaxID=2211445 RepID=A0A2V4C4H9_9FLAO|nr:hypothetical protein [Flavobacterium hydrophilum]PXY44830.1 hypothetical protein DMB68_15380 [Flavobacterium hydrophilum]
MNTITKISFCWLLIVVALAYHVQYEMSGLFFGKDIKSPEATGEIPYGLHYFNIAVTIIPLFFALLTAFVNDKSFVVASLVYAILFLLLNVFHVITTAMEDISNLTQMTLLTFVTVANVLLVLSINKWRKEVL